MNVNEENPGQAPSVVEETKAPEAAKPKKAKTKKSAKASKKPKKRQQKALPRSKRSNVPVCIGFPRAELVAFDTTRETGVEKGKRPKSRTKIVREIVKRWIKDKGRAR
jgi:hypothetical protein